MNIDEAIKILDEILSINFIYYMPSRRRAIQLGIEALKREKRNREDRDYLVCGLLLGETKD